MVGEVRFTSDVEKERKVIRPKAKWELFSSESLVATLHWARDNGWEKNKVQVRVTRIDDQRSNYSVEPYEKCGCPNILRYSDYFDGSSENTEQ